MAGLLRRSTGATRGWLRALLAPAADPRRAGDSAVTREETVHAQLARARSEVERARERLAQRIEALRRQQTELAAQAQRAQGEGREDVARLALQRRQGATAQLRTLEAHAFEVDREAYRLGLAAERVAAQMEALHMRRQLAAARVDAAAAQVLAAEALLGVGAESNGQEASLEQAEQHAEALEARAAALAHVIQGEHDHTSPSAAARQGYTVDGGIRSAMAIDAHAGMRIEEVRTEPVAGYPLLERRVDNWHRQPYLKGRNLPVGTLAWKMRVNGHSPEAAVEQYDLPLDQIREALRYCREHPDVIEQDRAEERAYLIT
jgi:phage shock protein A